MAIIIMVMIMMIIMVHCVGLLHPVYCNAFPSVIFTRRRHLAARWYRENTTQCVRSSKYKCCQSQTPTIWSGRVAFYKTDKTGPLPVHCLLCLSLNHISLQIFSSGKVGDQKDILIVNIATWRCERWPKAFSLPCSLSLSHWVPSTHKRRLRMKRWAFRDRASETSDTNKTFRSSETCEHNHYSITKLVKLFWSSSSPPIPI